MAGEAPVAAFLGLGGNLGDIAAALAEALTRLAAVPDVRLKRVSSVYRTPPWGKRDQPDFLNMAALAEMTLPAPALLTRCLEIERAMGRRRGERWGPRSIDIDILTYGEATIDAPELTVPHPRLIERAFALSPLAEIAPRLRVGGREVGAWLAEVDRSGVEIDAAASAFVRAAMGETKVGDSVAANARARRRRES